MRSGLYNKRLKMFFSLFLTLLCTVSLLAEQCFSSEELVTIYDDYDNGRFGRSEYRSIMRTVRLEAFSRSETLPVYSPALEENSYLTAVVLSSKRYEKLRPLMSGNGILHFKKEGIQFSYSLEKPGEKLLSVLDEYYRGSREKWRDPVRNHYLQNYVIRIHSAENIFEPWNDTVSYPEAMLMATLIGDKDQWLWGIHDGLGLIFP